MNKEQTDITTGKQIRHLRTQSGMTQEELAGELNVTRQALSNWERDVNEPDINTLKKICFLFGVHMDDLAKEVITKMETCEKKEKRQFNKYAQIASASWTPAGRNFVIIATVLVGASDSTKIGAAAAGQAA